MTMKEMFKERMTCRKSDPVRSKILGLLIDVAQKAARAAGREAAESDVAEAAKKMKAQTVATIADYEKGGADSAGLKAEIAVLDEFLPKPLSPAEIEAAVKKAFDSLDAESRNLKGVMPKLKEIPGIDMKKAKEIAEGLIVAFNTK